MALRKRLARGVVEEAQPASTSEVDEVVYKLEHTLVTELKQLPLKQRAKNFVRKARGHKRFKLAALGLSLIVIIGMAVWYIEDRKNEKPTHVSKVTDVCRDDINTYSDMASAIRRSDTKRAKTLFDDILLDPKYETDINCKTAVIEYHLFVSDTKTADAELQQLKAIAGSDTKLNEAYASIGLRMVKDVEDHVGRWKKISEQAKGNVIFTNPAK